MQSFTVDLYTGSRQGQSPGHQTIPWQLRLNSSMPMTADQLSRLISTTLSQWFPGGGCELQAKHIHPARWDADAQSWNLLQRQEYIKMPSTLQLAAVVLADGGSPTVYVPNAEYPMQRPCPKLLDCLAPLQQYTSTVATTPVAATDT